MLKTKLRLGLAMAALGLLLTALLAACGPAPVPAAEEPMMEEPAAEEAMPEGQYGESPILAARVAAGELPPVEERLPVQPFVVSNRMLAVSYDTEVGKYGGTMRLPQDSPGGDPHFYIGSNEYLLWAPGAFNYDMGIFGNVLLDWDVNEDNDSFTFHMREGLKWSDGVPVTTADVDFAVNDVMLHDEITPSKPAFLHTAQDLEAGFATIEILDDYTYTVTFDGRYGSFPAALAVASWRGYQDFLKPRHYLEQFHADYADADELAAKLDEEGIEEGQWYNLFNAKQMPGNLWRAIGEAGFGHPVLTPWVLTEFGGGSWTFDRNPYYFKVDRAGNQLPYIDQVQMLLMQDRESTVLQILSGEVDYLGERSSLNNLPLLKQAETEGVLNVIIPRMHRTPINFMMNLTYPDPAWRKVTNDVRFRQAMTLAINKQEIIDTFYLGEFGQLPVHTNYPEFNIEKANQILDEMGMSERDANGFRLDPDGNPFQIIFEPGPLSQDHVPMTELIAEYWKAVGIDTDVKAGEWSLINQRYMANDLQATAIWNVMDMWPSVGWFDYLPDRWGRAWVQYMNSDGETGEEPPDEVKEIYDLHNRFLRAPLGSQENKDILEEIFVNQRDNYWTFNPVEFSYYPTSTSARIKNVPKGRVEEMGIVFMHSMEEWYIDE